MQYLVFRHALRESVVSLETYAGYIRDNNMQSLQTPNYGIETAMGMEKFLIGYSELAWMFIKYYKNASLSIANENQFVGREYLPVVVPDLHNNEVKVEVLFPDYNIIDKNQSTGSRQYLLVIGSSTFEELSDVPSMMIALMHEIAHQFRYEKRAERNEMVFQVMLEMAMYAAAEEINITVSTELGGILTPSIEFFARTLSEVCKSIIENKEEDIDCNNYRYYKEMSLEVFERKLVDDVSDLLEAWYTSDNLDKGVQNYLREMCADIIFSQNDIGEEIKGLKECIKSPKENAEMEKTITEYAYKIAWKCAEECLTLEQRICLNFVSSEVFNIGQFEQEWKSAFESKNNKYINQKKVILDSFLIWLRKYLEQDYPIINSKHMKAYDVEGFEDSLYKVMRQKWKEKIQKIEKQFQQEQADNQEKEDKKDIISGGVFENYHYWTCLGKKFGLDYDSEDNKKLFNTSMKSVLQLNYTQEIFSAQLQYNICLYREITADMFMYIIADMKPIQYLNLLASLFAENNGYANSDKKRAFYVLFLCNCVKSDGLEEIIKAASEKEQERIIEKTLEDTWEKFREFYCDICSELRSICLIKLEELHKDIIMPKDKQKIEFLWDDKSPENLYQALENTMAQIQKWKERIQEIENENILEEPTSVLERIKNIQRIYQLLEGIFLDGKERYHVLRKYKKFFLDLYKGKEHFCKCKNAVSTFSDNSVKSFVCISEEMAKFLDIQDFVRKDNSFLNKMSIEILLKMYYNNKIREAQSKGGTRNVN